MALRTVIKMSSETFMDPSSPHLGTIRNGFPGLDLLWADGTDSNEADLFWYHEASLALSTTVGFDLTALTDHEGNALVFAEVRYMAFHSEAANAVDGVSFKPNSTNGLDFISGTGGLVVHPAHTVVPINGGVDGQWPVDASNKSIQVVNLSAAEAIDFKLLIIGTSA